MNLKITHFSGISMSWELALLLVIVFTLGILFHVVVDRNTEFSLSDLIIDSTTGKVSSSRFWYSVGNLVATWAFVFLIIKGLANEWTWFIYLGLLTGNKTAEKMLTLKYQPPDQSTKNE